MPEQAELRGNPMGPNGPPTACTYCKGNGLNRPRNRHFRKPGLLGHFWSFWKNRPFRPFWPTNSEPRWTSRRKLPLGVWLRSTRPNYIQNSPRGKFRWGEIQNDDLGCAGVRLAHNDDGELYIKPAHAVPFVSWLRCWRALSNSERRPWAGLRVCG